MGCDKQLSGSHRKIIKSKATSTQDSNHSDASGRVSRKTTRRGNGAQITEAMDNISNRKVKMAGETCYVEERVSKGNLSRLKNPQEREGKSDIRK